MILQIAPVRGVSLSAAKWHRSPVKTHSKVECDFLALLLVVGIKAGLLVGNQLVSQCCRRDLGGKQGEEPVCDCCQLHGGLWVVMSVLVEVGIARC